MKSLHFFALFPQVALLADMMGFEQELGRIVNGEEAREGSLPYQVSLQLHYGGKLESQKYAHFCGGALIGERYVITAAHCMKMASSSSRIKIVGGTNDISNKSSPAFRVKKIIRHNYNVDTKENDLALLELDVTSETLSNIENLSPISLCRSNFELPGRRCIVSGWGHMKARGSHVTEKLRQASLMVLKPSVCTKLLSAFPWDSIKNTMLCAGGTERDACQGDSGGPLVCTGDHSDRCLAGVVSWGVGCATEGIPGVYTNIKKYAPWIDGHMKNRI